LLPPIPTPLPYTTLFRSEVLADPSESLKPANPVVHVPEPNRLWREVSRDFDDMKEAELRVLGAGDACAEFDEGLVLELPEREEDAVPLELHVVLRRRQDVAHLRGRVGRNRTARGSAASNPMIREPDREPHSAEEHGERPGRNRRVPPGGVIPEQAPRARFNAI